MRNVFALFHTDTGTNTLIGVYSTLETCKEAVNAYRLDHGDPDDLLYVEIGLDAKPDFLLMENL